MYYQNTKNGLRKSTDNQYTLGMSQISNSVRFIRISNVTNVAH